MKWFILDFEVLIVLKFLISEISLRQMWFHVFAVRAYVFRIWVHVLLFLEEFLYSLTNHSDCVRSCMLRGV